MSTQQFLELADDGPLCSLTEVVVNILNERSKSRPRTLLDILPFASGDELSKEAQAVFEQLQTLDLYFRGSPSTHSRQVCLEAVAGWIHYSNKIEFTGVGSAGDTLAALSGKIGPETKGYFQTMDTYALLKESYLGCYRPVYDYIPDENSLKNWHRILLKNSDLQNAGNFRTAGAYADNRDQTAHKFPHHSSIQDSVRSLCGMIHDAATKMVMLEDGEQVLFTFALAAFAQYHLVSIHPYADGNGRMCRFLSKRLLDSICPIPFPMFSERNEYLLALEDGRRNLDPLQGPALLLKLLLKEAKAYFAKQVLVLQNRSGRLRFATSQAIVLDRFLRDQKLAPAKFLEAFDSMKPGETREIQYQNVILELRRIEVYLSIEGI